MDNMIANDVVYRYSDVNYGITDDQLKNKPIDVRGTFLEPLGQIEINDRNFKELVREHGYEKLKILFWTSLVLQVTIVLSI